jgi:hypothetical protein
MTSALTYREGRPDGSDPVEMFFDVVGFLLGCMPEEVGLEPRYRTVSLFIGRVVVPQSHRGETLIKKSQHGEGLPFSARRLLARQKASKSL